MKRSALTYVAGFLSCGLVLVLVAATQSPTRAIPDRDVYYPGSEDLAADEMRIVALGTGMPSVRPKQAAACLGRTLGMPVPSATMRISSGARSSLAG